MGSGTSSSLDIPAGRSFNGTEQSATLDFLAHKLRLSPRSEEAGVLDKLESQITSFVEQNYGDIDLVVKEFFDKVDDSPKVDGRDLERTILAIQKVIYVSTDTVSRLYQDAYFADRTQQDEYWNAYKAYDASGKKTIADRQAYAYEQSRDARFYYYYVYLLWRKLEEKRTALKDLQRTLEFQRNRAVKDKNWS